MLAKVIGLQKEYEPSSLKTRLVIEVELEDAVYNGDEDVDEVVFVMKPKILKPTYRREVEWK